MDTKLDGVPSGGREDMKEIRGSHLDLANNPVQLNSGISP